MFSCKTHPRDPGFTYEEKGAIDLSVHRGPCPAESIECAAPTPPGAAGATHSGASPTAPPAGDSDRDNPTAEGDHLPLGDARYAPLVPEGAARAEGGCAKRKLRNERHMPSVFGGIRAELLAMARGSREPAASYAHKKFRKSGGKAPEGECRVRTSRRVTDMQTLLRNVIRARLSAEPAPRAHGQDVKEVVDVSRVVDMPEVAGHEPPSITFARVVTPPDTLERARDGAGHVAAPVLGARVPPSATHRARRESSAGTREPRECDGPTARPSTPSVISYLENAIERAFTEEVPRRVVPGGHVVPRGQVVPGGQLVSRGEVVLQVEKGRGEDHVEERPLPAGRGFPGNMVSAAKLLSMQIDSLLDITDPLSSASSPHQTHSRLHWDGRQGEPLHSHTAEHGYQTPRDTRSHALPFCYKQGPVPAHNSPLRGRDSSQKAIYSRPNCAAVSVVHPTMAEPRQKGGHEEERCPPGAQWLVHGSLQYPVVYPPPALIPLRDLHRYTMPAYQFR